MQIQLNTDKNIIGSDSLHAKVEKILLQQLKHLAADLTRIEVHLNDENSGKSGGSDKRCQLEARISGKQPVSTEHRAETIDLAVHGAATQLVSALKSTLDKSRATSRESIKHADQSLDDDTP